MIVEVTSYYALPGRSEDVLRQRRHATALRVGLGLPPGRISVAVEGPGPDVRWECIFPSQEAYQADLSKRGSSAAFAAARQAMHQLLDRFERRLEQIVDLE